jgi:hypothetical protein
VGSKRTWALRAGVLLGLASMLLLAACASSAPAATLGDTLPASETSVPSQPLGIVALETVLPGLPATWRTYTDANLGYTLRFPQDAEFTSGMSKAGIYTARLQFRVPGADGYQGMVLRVEPNPEGRGIEQIVQEIYRRNLLAEPPADWRQQLGGVTVAGLSGVQLGRGPDISLIVPAGGRIYIIAPVHGTATTAVDPKALELFYQILASLRLAP